MPEGYCIVIRKAEWYIQKNGTIVSDWRDDITNVEIMQLNDAI